MISRFHTHTSWIHPINPKDLIIRFQSAGTLREIKTIEHGYVDRLPDLEQLIFAKIGIYILD